MSILITKEIYNKFGEDIIKDYKHRIEYFRSPNVMDFHNKTNITPEAIQSVLDNETNAFNSWNEKKK